MRACRVCGETFAVERKRGRPAVYCGDACRVEGLRSRARAWSRRQTRLPRPLLPPLIKSCRWCEESFLTRAAGRPRLTCSPYCAHRVALVARYGLSVAEYREMEAVGVCHSCGGEFAAKGPQIDHCHESGRVRGLLCTSCNLAIGHAKDDASVQFAQAVYLARSDLDLRELCLR